MGYILRQSRSSRDAFARALSEAERVRCFRADLQSAPERLWASFSSVLRPRCGVLPLDWDRRGRVTPAGTESQEAWPGAEPGCESPGESRGEAPEGERAPELARFRARASASGNVCRCCAELVGCAFRRSTSLFSAHDLVRKPGHRFRDQCVPEANLFLSVLWSAKRRGADRVERECSIIDERQAKQSRAA